MDKRRRDERGICRKPEASDPAVKVAFSEWMWKRMHYTNAMHPQALTCSLGILTPTPWSTDSSGLPTRSRWTPSTQRWTEIDLQNLSKSPLPSFTHWLSVGLIQRLTYWLPDVPWRRECWKLWAINRSLNVKYDGRWNIGEKCLGLTATITTLSMVDYNINNS